MSAPGAADVAIRALGPDDGVAMLRLLDLFGEAFDEADVYGANRPGAAYLRRLLGGEQFIALAAMRGDAIVGGLAAYVLPKFEQPRSEIYIYDLAVSAPYRRRGIATALIERLRAMAVERGAWVVFVQADSGDEPAIALYSRIGAREDVLHFDIPVADDSGGGSLS